MKYRSFQNMDVWKTALNLSVEVYQLSSNLPKCEDYGLTSQIRRSANSVNANIAEAFGRETSPDKNRIYIFARGSAFETQSHLMYSVEVGYFDKTISKTIIDKYENLLKSLNKKMKTIDNKN